jgi:hypothetical protein
VRQTAALCFLILALVAGCGGSDDRPDLEATPPTTEPLTSETAPTTEVAAPANTGASPTQAANSAPLPANTQRRIASQANDVEAAVTRWNDRVSACVGPSGTRDDAGASCTRAAWDQLFDQMYVAQYELLDLLDRMGAGRCHEALASVVDSVHGFLSGATPTKVVWLDEQQRPPSLFDLESIVDLVRPVPAHIRRAAATACRA